MTVTQERGAALAVVLPYYHAWTRKDIDTAMTYVADDVVCDAPAGRVEGAKAFRDFFEPFSQLITESELIAAFGDDERAVLIYDAHNVVTPNAPTGELLTVRDGRIVHSLLVFDRKSFDDARAASSR